MRLKVGVSLKAIQPQIAVALQVAEGVYRHLGGDLVVTSCNDSKHSGGSLHYRGLAADLRTKYMRSGFATVAQKTLAEALGAEFDVILEDKGGNNEHLHLEWDPDKPSPEVKA